MKRLAPLGLAVVLVATALASSPTGANGQSPGLISSVLNRMERNRQSLKSLRAGISMEKYNAQLRDADKFYGVVVYVPAAGRNYASVRIDWSSPQHEILAVAKGEYTLFRPRLNVAYKGSARSSKNKAGNILNLMDMSRAELQASFEPFQEAREETLWGGVSTIHLKLVPRRDQGFKYAEIWVDSSGMPVQAKVIEKNDDATTIRLNNLEKNTSILSDEFNVKLDSNVKIIKG